MKERAFHEGHPSDANCFSMKVEIKKEKLEIHGQSGKKLKNRKNEKTRKKNGRLKSQLFFSCRLPKNSAYRGEGEGLQTVVLVTSKRML